MNKDQTLHGLTITKLLEGKPVTNVEYRAVSKACRKVATRALKAHKLETFCWKPTAIEEAIDEVATTALVKALKGYKSGRASFSTYFFNKARSCARVQAGKLARRTRINNAYSLEEYNENYQKKYDQD